MTLEVIVDMGVIAMKSFLTVSRVHRLEAHHLMQFCVITWSLMGRVFPKFRDSVGVIYIPN